MSWIRRVAPVVAVMAGFVAFRLAAPRSPLPAFVPSDLQPSPLGEPARRVGSIYLCPLDAAYRAFAPDRLVYPPNHPSPPPPSDRPARCFQSAGQAAFAGYSLAPEPSGTVSLHGVYLVPTDGVLLQQCRRAARALGFPVPCPGLLPGRVSGAGPARCESGGFEEQRGCVYTNFAWPPQPRRRWFLLQEGAIALPPGYPVSPTTGPLTNTLVLQGYPPRYGGAAARSFGFGCPGPQRVGRTSVRWTEGVYRVCGAGGADATISLTWLEQTTAGPVVVSVSLKADEPENRDLLVAVASGLRMVPPP